MNIENSYILYDCINTTKHLCVLSISSAKRNHISSPKRNHITFSGKFKLYITIKESTCTLYETFFLFV